MNQPQTQTAQAAFPPMGGLLWPDFETAFPPRRQYVDPATAPPKTKAGGSRAHRRVVSAIHYPSGALTHYDHGWTLASQGRWKEALVAFDRAIDFDPIDALAHTCRGWTLANLKRFDEALDAFDNALRLHNHAFDDAIRIDPDIARAFWGRGFTLSKFGRWKEASEALERAICFDPDAAPLHGACGVALNVIGRLDEAVDAFERAVSLDSNDTVSLRGLGWTLNKLGRYDQAFVALGRAVDLDPNNALAHFLRGTTLSALAVTLNRRERFAEAVDAFDHAIGLDPDHAEAHFNRGLALIKLERFGEALVALDRAVDLDPANADYRKVRDVILTHYGRPEVSYTNIDANEPKEAYNYGVYAEPIKATKTGTTSKKDEGLLSEPMIALLKYLNVPESRWPETAAEIERLVATKLGAVVPRPKWDERGKYAELKDLSAPLFLKRVYADVIGPDGAIEKQVVRKKDPKLMARVETYISTREERRQDAGDAAGLRLITGEHRRPKRAGLG